MWCAVLAALCGAHLHAVQASPVKLSPVTRHSSRGLQTQVYTPQCIRAWALDYDGEVIAEASVTLHVADPGAPAAPADLTADPIGESAVQWHWSDSSTTASQYRVYFCTGAGPPTTLLRTIPATAPYWASTGLQANTRYCIGVAAVDSLGRCSDTVTLGAVTRPVMPSYAFAGPGAVYCNNGPGNAAVSFRPRTQFTFTAPNGFGAGPICTANYAYMWDQNPVPDFKTPASVWAAGQLVISPVYDGSYYLHLWARNEIGLTSTRRTLGPYVIRQTCAHAKTRPTTETITLVNKTVSGVFADGTYVQEPDCAGGIRVKGVSAAPGSLVTVQGKIAVESGEAVLKDAVLLSAVSGKAPKPVLMTNKALGGAQVGAQPAPVDSTTSPSGLAGGLSPTGLLVKATGTVTYVDPAHTFAYINDGSSLDDGSGHLGLRVSLENAPAPEAGSFAEVIGCCATTELGGRCVRLLRPRTPTDVQYSQPRGHLQNSGFESVSLTPWIVADGTSALIAQAVTLGAITPHSGSQFLAKQAGSVPYSGAMAQVVPVQPGRYHLSAWSRVFHGTLGSTTATSRIGIDPTGGTYAGSMSIAWSAWDIQLQSGYSEWRELTTPSVNVTTGACTVFLQYVQRAAYYQVNCFDDAVLVKE